MAEYQVQLQHENADGIKTNIYPINTGLDVMVGELETPTILQLPGVKKDETLKTSLENIKLYLENLSNIASYKRKVSSSLSNENDKDLATSKAVFDLKKMIDDDRLDIAKKAPTIHSSENADTYGAGTDVNFGHVKLSDVYTELVSAGSAKMSMGASQNALYNAYKVLNDAITQLTENFNNHSKTNASDLVSGHVKIGSNITHKDGVISITSDNLIAAFGYDPVEKFSAPYTNGEGISISDSKIINAGVRSISSGNDNGTLSVDTNGIISSITIPGLKSAAFTESSAYAQAQHDHTRLSGFKDERSVDTLPSNYNGTLKVSGLKSNSVINSPDTSNFSTLLGIRGWIDSTGGHAHELAFSGSGKLFRRSGLETWGTWKEIIDSGNYNNYAPSLTGANASGDWGINITGNAATADIFKTARKINGTAFDGSKDITTALWGTARNITIGGVTKSIDGSKDIEYSLAEIGVSPSGHEHNYAGSSTAGGSANSSLKLGKTSTFASSAEGALYYYDANITNTANTNGWSAPATGWHQILHMSLSVANYWNELAFPINDTKGLAWRQRRGETYSGWFRLLDSNNYKDYVTPANIGAAPSTHDHNYLPLAGGTMNSNASVIFPHQSDTRKLKISNASLTTITPATSWANGWGYKDSTDTNVLGGIGAYGQADTLEYYYFGTWDVPVAKLTKDGVLTTSKFTGDGSSLTNLNPSNLSAAVPASKGGSGKTTLRDSANAYINALDAGTSTPVDADYIISQYVGGGTSNTSFIRRPISALWSYIQNKANSVYLKLTGGTMTGNITFPVAESAISANGIIYGSNLARIGCNTSGGLGIYAGETIYLRPGSSGSIDTTEGVLIKPASLAPSKDGTMSLGLTSNKWSNIHTSKCTIGGAIISYNSSTESIDFTF